MELIVALVLFIGLIVSWLLLPGSTSGAERPELTPADANNVGRSTASQPA